MFNCRGRAGGLQKQVADLAGRRRVCSRFVKGNPLRVGKCGPCSISTRPQSPRALTVSDDGPLLKAARSDPPSVWRHRQLDSAAAGGEKRHPCWLIAPHDSDPFYRRTTIVGARQGVGEAQSRLTRAGRVPKVGALKKASSSTNPTPSTNSAGRQHPPSSGQSQRSDLAAPRTRCDTLSPKK